MNDRKINWKSEELALIYKSVSVFISRNGRQPSAVSIQDKDEVESVLPENRRKNPISRDAFNCIMSRYRKLLDGNGVLKIELKPVVEKPELLVVSQEIMVEMSHMFDEKLKPVIAAIQSLSAKQEEKVPGRKEVKFNIKDTPVPDQRFRDAIAVRPPAVYPSRESHQYSPLTGPNLVPIIDKKSNEDFWNNTNPITTPLPPYQDIDKLPRFVFPTEDRIREIFKEEFEKIFGSKETLESAETPKTSTTSESRVEVDNEREEHLSAIFHGYKFIPTVGGPIKPSTIDESFQKQIFDLVKVQTGTDVPEEALLTIPKKIFVYGVNTNQTKNIQKSIGGAAVIASASIVNDSARSQAASADFVICSKFCKHTSFHALEKEAGKDKVKFASGGITMIKNMIKAYIAEQESVKT